MSSGSRAVAVVEPVGVPRELIVAGVLQLAESAGRHVTEATFAVYERVCGPAMTPSEWLAVVDEALERWEGWPSTATLLRLHRELRAAAADENPTEAELDAQQRRADEQARSAT